MDILSGISAVTQGLSIAKTLRSIEKNYDEATYKAQIADLINALTDAKLALSEAKDSLSERDKEIERLRASFEARGTLAKGNGDYNYLADSDGNPVGYPVCPKCDQLDGRIIQTKEHERSGQSRCPACDKIYGPVESYLPQGSGYATKQQKESAEWSASVNSSRRRTSYF